MQILFVAYVTPYTIFFCVYPIVAVRQVVEIVLLKMGHIGACQNVLVPLRLSSHVYIS